MNKSIFMYIVLIVIALACAGCFFNGKDSKKSKSNGDFSIDLIKSTFKKSNYLISPYSIEIALNMLKTGANSNTKKELDNVLPNRTISDVSINNRIKIANAIFIKDDYKNKVKEDFKVSLIDKHNAELLIDAFKTPDAINNWVNKNTDGMIKKILNNIDDDFVLGLANAVAIDVEWLQPFDCSRTKKEEFTKDNGKKIKVEMMHNTFTNDSFEYLKTKDAEGIIIPYKSYDKKTGKIADEDGYNLEFIGILPKKSVESYIDTLSTSKLNELIDSGTKSSRTYEIKLSLPRFKYDYSADKFKENLIQMGIKDVFDINRSDLSKMMDKSDMNGNLYVSTAIHKTHINLNEKGTKAAAVTYFGVSRAAALIPENKEIVEVKFNKPFVYMIRDKQTKEILFFGAVYEPNLWDGSTCSNEI